MMVWRTEEASNSCAVGSEWHSEGSELMGKDAVTPTDDDNDNKILVGRA